MRRAAGELPFSMTRKCPSFLVARRERGSDDRVSPHGHDKSVEIRKYSSLPEGQRPTMFYAGDGISDLSAAKETDLLFAKAGKGKDIFVYNLHEFPSPSNRLVSL